MGVPSAASPSHSSYVLETTELKALFKRKVLSLTLNVERESVARTEVGS